MSLQPPPPSPSASAKSARAAAEPEHDHSLPVIGLAGSSGSIPGLQAFFRAMPPQSGMAFVVVLDGATRQHEGGLPELLRVATRMPVVQVADVEPVRTDHVYLIPPGKALASMNGRLQVSDLPPEHSPRVAIDLSFRTLADSHGPHSAAIVLSGSDGAGTVGIKRIRERGGLAIAQEPSEAQHPMMPAAAIATGLIDWVLPVQQMPDRLLRYHALERRLQLPPEEGPAGPISGAEGESALKQILALLQTLTGHDFSHYKRSSTLRRIARRMQVNEVADLPAYLNFLRAHSSEPITLVKDLLIRVTQFFRDAAAFSALEAHIPRLFEGKGPDDAVRVWIPACATGEEAYSIAILLCEHARTLRDPSRLQVFASDLDRDSIRVAREAVYPAAIAADMTQERLERHFRNDDRGFRVRHELRETVLFARHDVLRDSPFSQLDLVSCRTLLGDLNATARSRLLEVIHFALRPHGLLFVGADEQLNGDGALFRPLEQEKRIYVQRPPERTGRRPPVRAAEPPRGPRIDLPVDSADQAEPYGTMWRDVHREFVELAAAPSILVNRAHEMLHVSTRAWRYLRDPRGTESASLMHSIHSMLRIDLRTTLQQAADSRSQAVTHAVPFELDGELRAVDLRVNPAKDPHTDLMLVSFDNERAALTNDDRPAVEAAGSSAREHELELETARLRSQLRDTVQRHDISTEELTVSNEELQTTNEELRSSTEQLATGREELQSINVELTTVNQELKAKVDELARINSDLNNLMSATAIATVFVGRDLRVMRYTPSAVPLFRFIPTDIGRPLADLAHRLEYREMLDDAQRAIDHLQELRREVRSASAWYLVRVLPYRTSDDHIGGAVFTFLDITARKHAEDALRASEERFRAIVNQAWAGVAYTDLSGRIIMANRRFADIVGRGGQDISGHLILEFTHPDDRDRERALFDRLSQAGAQFEIEKRLLRDNRSEVWVKAAVTPIRDIRGQQQSAVAIVLDVSDAARVREALQMSEERLRLIIENAREFAIISTDLQRRVTSWNSGAERMLGYAEKEILLQSADVIFTAEDRAAGAPELEARRALRDGRASDQRWHVRKDGSRFWGNGVMTAMHGPSGSIVGLVKIFRDETAARETADALEQSRRELWQALAENSRARVELEAASHAKDQFLAALSHELRTPLTPVLMAVQALSLRPDLPQDARDALEVIRRNVRLEAHFIDDLLDLTRMSKGELEVLREPVDLHDVIRAALEVCGPDIQTRQQHLDVALEAPRHLISGDSRRLQQVVWNVIQNASKFTPPRGGIRVTSSNDDDRFRLIVTDSGVGIEPQVLPVIFDAFTQGSERISREQGGLGLGLAISKATVEAHGGHMAAESAGTDRGTTITMELPLV
jgi:two-component system, chemotaxis family, CheB/CheR fusion protein